MPDSLVQVTGLRHHRGCRKSDRLQTHFSQNFGAPEDKSELMLVMVMGGDTKDDRKQLVPRDANVERKLKRLRREPLETNRIEEKGDTTNGKEDNKESGKRVRLKLKRKSEDIERERGGRGLKEADEGKKRRQEPRGDKEKRGSEKKERRERNTHKSEGHERRNKRKERNGHKAIEKKESDKSAEGKVDKNDMRGEKRMHHHRHHHRVKLDSKRDEWDAEGFDNVTASMCHLLVVCDARGASLLAPSLETNSIEIASDVYNERRQHKLSRSDALVCNCKCTPGEVPCGRDCLNRLLNVECTPGTCPTGLACTNQGLQRAQYPKLQPFMVFLLSSRVVLLIEID